MYICIVLVCFCLSFGFQKYIANYTKLPKDLHKFKMVFILTSLSSALSCTTYYKTGLNVDFFLITIIVFCVVLLSIIDIICFEIPQNINFIMLAVSLVIVFINYENTLSYILGMSITGGIFLLIFLGSKGKGIGFGDVKLMFCGGLGLGFEKALLTFLVCFVTGAVFHPIFMKLFNKGSKLAFGPYIAFGIILSHLFGDEIITEYIKLFTLEGF